MAGEQDVRSAGVVVFRTGREVLLVHRPKYDDWSYPKGKLDRGEHATTAAVREVEEETGLHVRLGPPLASQRYPVGSRMKTVHYWTGRPVGDDDVSAYAANDEIDQVAWVGVDDAPRVLTYAYDRTTLEEALALRKQTRPLLVVRHAEARQRRRWRADDRQRPLLASGRRDALRLAPVLAAYDARRVVTSSSVRCVETVAPYAVTAGVELEWADLLSEEDATPEAVHRLVSDLAASSEPGLICTHRPVLPVVFEALGLEPVELEPSELFVVHLRKGVTQATERHLPA